MKGLAVLIITAIAIAWPALAQGKLAFGGTFWYLGLTLESFVEIPLVDVAAVRIGAGGFAGGDYTGGFANFGGLVGVGEVFHPYLGTEAIVGTFFRPENARLLAWDWLIGLYWKLWETYGLFAQIRFIKMLVIGGVGVQLPAVGIPLVEIGLFVGF